MIIETITVGSFAMNCYLIIDSETGEAIYIDPGAESDLLIKKLSQRDLKLKFVINTHCHIDHTAEASRVIDHFNVPFYIHRGELPLLNNLKEQGDFFGLPVQDIPKISEFVEDSQTLQFGNFQIKILHTPGHSPGGISILIEDSVFVGDCLFMDSIGRTDLLGGNHDQLIGSIKTKLLTLDDSTVVYPGHGPATTIERERKHNPFLQQ
jgi:glyoxylase-like metal-dependent hydrolase (beta-lactamase superfamily II)